MPQFLKCSDLQFDRKNPRLAEFGILPKTTDQEILEILWDSMDVRELVQSISASGFFAHEPLIVAKENRKNIVIEGNRRLAALRLLLGLQTIDTHGWEIPSLSKNQKLELESVPVIIENRKDAWRYLGFKHINGPAKWSSYAKAKYIAEVHDKYNQSLAEIAEQIGDRHKTVQRLYRGLMVINQAERIGVYDCDDRFNTRFAFSHLYTGLDGDGINQFLALKPSDDESESPVPLKKKKELGELLVWLYGSKKASRPPVVQKQNPNLWELNDVLKSREGIAALRTDGDLASALEISRPQSAVFEEALLKAKRELTRVRSALTEGYDGAVDLLHIAGTVAELADDIYSEMERKSKPGKRRSKRRGE